MYKMNYFEDKKLKYKHFGIPSILYTKIAAVAQW